MLHVYDFCSGKVHSWPGFSFHPGPMQPLQVAQLSGIHGLQCCKSLVKLSNLELAITISYDPAVWTTQHNSPKMMLGRSGKIPCLWSQPLPLLAACSSCQVTHDFSDTPQTTEPKIEVESGLLANEDDLWSFWWGIMISHQWSITLMRVEKECVVFVILIVSLISFGFFQVHLFHHVGINEVRVFLKHFKILLLSMVKICWTKDRVHWFVGRTILPKGIRWRQKIQKPESFCCAKREATEIQQPRVWMTTAVKWSDIENQWWGCQGTSCQLRVLSTAISKMMIQSSKWKIMLRVSLHSDCLMYYVIS